MTASFPTNNPFLLPNKDPRPRDPRLPSSLQNPSSDSDFPQKKKRLRPRCHPVLIPSPISNLHSLACPFLDPNFALSFPIPSFDEHLAPLPLFSIGRSTRSALIESPNANSIPSVLKNLFFSTLHAQCRVLTSLVFFFCQVHRLQEPHAEKK
jgi:hypothetical protein